MDMRLSKLQEIVKDWCAAIHGVTKSQTWLTDWTTGKWEKLDEAKCVKCLGPYLSFGRILSNGTSHLFFLLQQAEKRTWSPGQSTKACFQVSIWTKRKVSSLAKGPPLGSRVSEESTGKACAGLCLVTQPCPTLCDPMDCSLPGSSIHGDSPGKNTEVGSHALPQGIFPAQGLNPGLPHCRQILYCLSCQGSPRILEWVAYPFSRGSSCLVIKLGSPALQADSLLSEPPQKETQANKSLLENSKLVINRTESLPALLEFGLTSG